MKKLSIIFGFMFAFLLCFSVPVSADTLPRVVDEAGLISSGGEASLEARIAAMG